MKTVTVIVAASLFIQLHAPPIVGGSVTPITPANDGNKIETIENHYAVERTPYIDYKYVVFDLSPQEIVWWKRGTHRFKTAKPVIGLTVED